MCVCVLPPVALMLSHVFSALNLNRNYWAYSLAAEYSTAVATPSEELTGYTGTEKDKNERGETN